MGTLLNNPVVVEILLTLIGLAWTAFKASEWYKAHVTDARMSTAIDAIAAAVVQTYQEYVKVTKEKSADGKLTAEEAAEARRLAKEKAIALAQTKGIDLVQTVGEGFIDLYIERKVQDAKQRAV